MKKTFVYKHIDGCEIKGDFYEAARTHAPLIVYIHGGGLIWGSRQDMMSEQIELYLRHGFHVCTIDYRLAPETKLAGIVSDIEDALTWLRNEGAQQFPFDPEKIAVIGSSAGAFLALQTGTFAMKPKAIISFYGYGSILGEWYHKPSTHYQKMTNVPEMLARQLIQNKTISEAPIERRYAIYMYCRQQGKWNEFVSDKNPITDAEELAAFCPIQHIAPDYPATLLLHGTKDEDVPYEESVAMRDALTTVGIKNELITIENGKHVFDEEMKAPAVKTAFVKVIDFLQTELA